MPAEDLTGDVNIEDWVRWYLTGDINSDVPTETELALLTPDAIDWLSQIEPALFDVDGNEVVTTARDLRSFNKAIALLIAAAYVRTPAGQQYANNLVQVKIGPITETRQAISIEDAVTFALTEVRRVLARISILRTRRADDPAVQVMGTVRVMPDRERPITLPPQDRWW